MEERDPPSPSPLQVLDPSTAQKKLPVFEPGTYVVQIPKDQIYRVPPPENSLIAQSYRNPDRNKRKASCSSYTYCFIVIAIFIILIVLAIVLSFVLLKPKNPKFQIQNFLVKSIVSNKSHPKYNITLQIDNPNRRSSILYKEDGLCTLYFKKRLIATGNFPSFLQDNGDVVKVSIIFKTSGGALPYEIKKSMKKTNSSDGHNIALSLKLEIPTRMKINSFTTGDTKLLVTCDFRVDKMSKGTRVLYQECYTEQH